MAESARSPTRSRPGRPTREGLCRWCGTSISDPRRSYCSQACRDKAAGRRVRIAQRLIAIEQQVTALRLELRDECPWTRS